MNSTIKLLVLLFYLCSLQSVSGDTQCGGSATGSGMAPQNTVLFVWAKTVDDPSTFPNWSNTLPSTLTNFYQVMSYNQHTVTTKIATKNGGFFVPGPGHDVSYYKNLFLQSPQGYVGPFGIFVKEILAKVEAEYGAVYFNDVSVISMMITDGGTGWYFPNINATGVAYLGTTYTTGNGKTFNRGICSEFAEGEKSAEWLVCHEYGHFIGLEDLPKSLGTYSLMQNVKVNDPNEGVTPLSVKDVIDFGWLNESDPTRVKTVTANMSVTLQQLRSPTGIVAAKVLPDPIFPEIHFLIANHQRSTNIYDGTYPADGLLMWHIEGLSYMDIECAIGTDPIAHGFNKDHLELPQSDPNYHGEGLASDFFNQTGQNQFTPWTNPNTDYSGSNLLPSNLAITNITTNDNSRSFDVIYNFASGTITVDSWWKNSLIINGNVTLNSGKALTLLSDVNAFLTGNSTFTLKPSATLYVDGTLEIDRNVTITGGGGIIKNENGKVFVTHSVSALASNNSRKIARGVNGNYHVVFETVGEICYERITNTGDITEFRRLSNGVNDGVKSNPSIYVRDNSVLVVWQKLKTNGSHDITFHKSTDYGVTWPSGNRQVIAGDVGSNPPLPVIASQTANELIVVYRRTTPQANLSFQTSSNNGATWSAFDMVPSSGAQGNSPSLAVTTFSSSPATGMANATSGGVGTIFYRYYQNTSWASVLTNLSTIVPGTYTGHKNPSLASSGTAGNTTLHVAWEAKNASNNGVIIHRKATSLNNWTPNTYYTVALGDGKQASITGLQNDSAELLFEYMDISQSSPQIFRVHFTGEIWDLDLFSTIDLGFNPSISVGYETAKYIWTSYNTTPPYQIPADPEIGILSKRQSTPLSAAYHRSIAVIDTAAGKWLDVRLDKLAVKTKSGEEFTIPFAEAKEDNNTLTPANAFANLASSSINLPADTESLFVHYQINGEGLSAVRKRDNAINIETALSIKNGATSRRPVINTSAEGLPQTKRLVALAASNLAGKEISLRTQFSGLDNKSSLIASLGHIYEAVETPVGKVLSPVVENAAPQEYALSAYPNPFNPSTQIHFVMKEAGRATVCIYNLNGQLLRELLNEPRAAGEHTVS